MRKLRKRHAEGQEGDNGSLNSSKNVRKLEKPMVSSTLERNIRRIKVSMNPRGLGFGSEVIIDFGTVLL